MGANVTAGQMKQDFNNYLDVNNQFGGYVFDPQITKFAVPGKFLEYVLDYLYVSIWLSVDDFFINLHFICFLGWVGAIFT